MSGGWKFNIKVPADSVSGENPLPGSQTAIIQPRGEGAFWGLFYRDTTCNSIPEDTETLRIESSSEGPTFKHHHNGD